MKYITSHYKKMNIKYIKVAVLVIIVSIFFLPSFVPFEKMGNNMFTVILNSREVGVVSSPGEAEEYLIAARRKLAETSEECPPHCHGCHGADPGGRCKGYPAQIICCQDQ